MRMLITPKPGYAVISADITGAEDWLAAGYSGDPKLMEIYSSGKDSYVEFAAITGAVPPGTDARQVQQGDWKKSGRSTKSRSWRSSTA